MDAPPAEAETSAVSKTSSGLTGSPVFNGPAWVGGQWQRTQCHEFPDQYRVRVGLGPVFSVGRPNGEVACVEQRGGVSRLAQATLEGPASILSDALRGVFCLHSSANYAPSGGIAFLGASGRGKSTLASILDQAGWPRLADDILRLRIDGASVLMGTDASSRLAALYLLADDTAITQTHRLRGSEALRTLVEQSVGARLFGAELLRAHFEFCGQLCALVPIYRLAYPRRHDIGATLRAMITADAASIGGHRLAD